ncbi:MAG: HTH domain-containing protein [Candidatus Pacearchaeota archaeon]|nr:HTH domain-containing protein [Candidatus Pacearchaeota archaeon]
MAKSTIYSTYSNLTKKTKTREITITEDDGTFSAFSSFFKKFSSSEEDYNFEGVSLLRKLLSNEKAKILHIIKQKKPSSIYSLARILNRDFKSVSSDIKLLERFGFIEMVAEKTGNRERLKPILAVDSLTINFKF